MKLDVFRYDTLEACMAAFYGCTEIGLLDQPRTRWEHKGRETVWPIRRVIRNRKKIGTWGWAENKKAIHVWITKEASMQSVIHLVAHELGHLERPYRMDKFEEERKAVKYSEVATLAFEISEDLISKVHHEK